MFKRIDESKIEPDFLSKCKTLIENCEKRGVSYIAISGFRSPEEQAKLYAQGRTSTGKIITKAKPFNSYHNFGIAIDFCRDIDRVKPGLQPSYNIEDYKILAEEAEKLGLVAGLNFKSFTDAPHIQIKTDRTLQQLKQAYENGGLQAVWDIV